MFYKKGFKACNLIKKRLQHSCFPVKIAKFLRTPNLRNICKRLLLSISMIHPSMFYCTKVCLVAGLNMVFTALTEAYLVPCQSLRGKCPYPEFFWQVFSRIWNEYGKIWSISPYSLRMQENTDRKISEYGHFLRSKSYMMELFCKNNERLITNNYFCKKNPYHICFIYICATAVHIFHEKLLRSCHS